MVASGVIFRMLFWKIDINNTGAKKITCPGALDKLNFKQDKQIFSPNVRRASKKFSASLFDNTFRTCHLATGQVKILRFFYPCNNSKGSTLYKGQGTVSQKILRLRYTHRTYSSSWRNTTSAIVSQQTLVMTTSSHF